MMKIVNVFTFCLCIVRFESEMERKTHKKPNEKKLLKKTKANVWNEW